MEIKRVGVVGCGLMGSGIAEVCARSGYHTVVSEANKELLERGLTAIRTSLAKGVERGKLTKKDEEAALSLLKGTTGVKDFADCDLVVEAIVENLTEKKKMFTTLDIICRPHAILVSNTSCLPLTEMAVATKRRQNVVGLHFFNPVPLMKLVELVRTELVSEDTVKTAKQFGESLGKTVIVAKDTPGFIVNRLLIPYLIDAIKIYEAGLATKEDIDQGMMLGCSHPIGPLSLADFIGLDTTNYIAQAMYEELKDAKVAPPVLLKRMVAAGRLGRKTGKGFYDYK